MNNPRSAQSIEAKRSSIKGQQVLIDRDVAQLYGVQTKRINEAVKNNPDKLPKAYMVALTSKDWNVLRSKISTAKHSTHLFSVLSNPPLDICQDYFLLPH